jgi:hypothetical protein
MKSKGPRRDNPTPDQGNPGNLETIKKFKAQENEGEMVDPSNTGQGEEGRGKQIPETRGTSKAAEGTEKPNSPPRIEADQSIEEGEISSRNETYGMSEAWDTPKRPRRGRKSKKVERDQETYKDVLKGAQPTIKKLIGVRQTRKLTKASEGGHSPPPNN